MYDTHTFVGSKLCCHTLSTSFTVGLLSMEWRIGTLLLCQACQSSLSLSPPSDTITFSADAWTVYVALLRAEWTQCLSPAKSSLPLSLFPPLSLSVYLTHTVTFTDPHLKCNN